MILCEIENCFPFLVRRIYIGAIFEKKVHDIVIRIRVMFYHPFNSAYERRAAINIRGIYICTCFQQESYMLSFPTSVM